MKPPALTPFTLESLAAYLVRRGLANQPEDVRARMLTDGVSNLTFWVDLPAGPLVVKQARAKLAVEMEWLADVRRILREAEAIDWWHRRMGSPHIPRLVFLHRDDLVMGMQAVPESAENYKTRLLRGEVQQDLANQFGHLLATLHNSTQDAESEKAFGDATFFDELRLSPYWDTAAERHPIVAPRLKVLRETCLNERYCLVHGDYSPKNILVNGQDLVLLDYEVAHFGNPSFDLGFALTHLLCKAIHLPAHGSEFIAAARGFWSAYQHTSELPPQAVSGAGHHLAATMLARMDGKSPLEYFSEEPPKELVRKIAIQTLQSQETGIDAVIDTVKGALLTGS